MMIGAGLITVAMDSNGNAGAGCSSSTPYRKEEAKMEREQIKNDATRIIRDPILCVYCFTSNVCRNCGFSIS
jgi:hypothetical protein